MWFQHIEPVIRVYGEDAVAGENDDQLGEGEVHKEPVDWGSKLQQEVKFVERSQDQFLSEWGCSFFPQQCIFCNIIQFFVIIMTGRQFLFCVQKG